jgi:uncharacterized damage-inducible protein DinB
MTRIPADIAKLFAYGRWANAQTLASVAELGAAEFAQPVGGSFGSVQGTLVHLYGADWVWLERWQGRSPRALPTAQEASIFDALSQMWREVQEKQREFVEALTEERMAQPLAYVNFKGETFTYPLGEILVHVANHGTYHRGQVATLLRQLGKTPASTDYLRYLDALAK